MSKLLMEPEYFDERLREETARCQRRGGSFSVVVFTCEPAEGELPSLACVRGLPSILSGVRGTDTVSRLGDDRIVVLLIDAEDEGARGAAMRLLERIGGELGHWQVRVLEYPAHAAMIAELSLAA